MGSARTEATKQRRERKRARKAAELSAKKLLRQATLAASTISQTSYEPTTISFQSIPPSPMAARANSRVQPWVQAGNPNLEPLGNRRGGLFAQLKPTGVVKSKKQPNEKRRHRTHTPAKGSLQGERGHEHGASALGSSPLALEFNRVIAERYVVYLHLAQG